jgi:hypothetical protein
MTIGIPEQTKNSFGITYLSKEESVGSHPESKYGKLSPKDQVAIHSTPTESRTPAFGIRSQPRATAMGQHSEPQQRAVRTSETKYIFNEPSYGAMSAPPKQAYASGSGNQGFIGTTQPVRASKPASDKHVAGVGAATNAPSNITNRVPSKQGQRTVDAGVGHEAGNEFDKREGVGDKWESADAHRKTERAVSAQSKRESKDRKIRIIQSKIIDAKHNESIGKLRGTGGKQPPEETKESNSPEEHEDHRNYDRRERKTTQRPKSKRPDVGYYSPKTNKINNIKDKAQLTIIKAQLLKVTAERYVRPSMASAGKKPATKMPNAGGIQDKLDMMSADSKNSTPDANTETSVTGSDKKVSDRYS